ncbi:hypothetical protein PCANC_03578 [Puccinia coronata f. sp. avenae]|uniref:CCHC-type domain-containing protein n=1 Tax=Puccinia coronata f. sp. avenae TaxID=200324 RepID=A0A2N5VUZ7_9BASI|nr:hypothetical protein PCANC_03578 [Puccinia coronata f. sp. avenae]
MNASEYTPEELGAMTHEQRLWLPSILTFGFAVGVSSRTQTMIFRDPMTSPGGNSASTSAADDADTTMTHSDATAKMKDRTTQAPWDCRAFRLHSEATRQAALEGVTSYGRYETNSVFAFLNIRLSSITKTPLILAHVLDSILDDYDKLYQQPNETAQSFFQRFREWQHKAKNYGFHYEASSGFVARLNRGLKEKVKGIVAVERRRGTPLTFDQIVVTALEEDQTYRTRTANSIASGSRQNKRPADTPAASTSKRPGGSGSKDGNTRACYNCGKDGHLSSNCPEPKTAKQLKYEAKKVSGASGSAPVGSLKAYLHADFFLKIEGRLANVLLDTGAGAFGDVVHSTRMCRLSLILMDHAFPVICRAAPLSQYNVILGRDWIAANVSSTNWTSNEWVMKTPDGKTFSFFPKSSDCSPSSIHTLRTFAADPELIPLSRKAFRREMNKSNTEVLSVVF